MPFFAAIAFEVALVALARRLRTRNSLLAATATIATVAVIAVGIQGYQEANATIEHSFQAPAMKMIPAAEIAFSWLRRHVRPDDTVINEYLDGSTWMYPDANVRPLIAFGGRGDGNISQVLALLTPDLKAREDLLDHVNLLGSSARVDALARRYHARWIYYGEATFYPAV